MSAGIDVTEQAILQPSQLFQDGLLNKHNPLNGIIENGITEDEVPQYTYTRILSSIAIVNHRCQLTFQLVLSAF